jgi:hypothetical protein
VIERTFVAWAVGAFVGVAVLATEVVSGVAFPGLDAFAAYSLVGGVIAAASRSVLAVLVSAPAARTGALGALTAFGALHALHQVNVRLLPGDHYLSLRSLVVDATVVFPLFGGALWLSRQRWAQEARERWGLPTAVLGGVTCLAGVALTLAAVPPLPADTSRRGEGPDLLLVVLDSVRADRLPFGVSHPATPRLLGLAKRGRFYSQAWAASSWTVPSVRRMLSAASPSGVATVAQRLVAHGYNSACFTDNPHLSEGARLLRGFDRVERSVGRWRIVLLGTALGEVVERLAPGSDERLATKALAWMERQTGPAFLYLHLMDSHTPYRFSPIDGRRRGGRRIEFPVSGMRMTAEEAESIRARYDGGVKSADAEAGRVLDALAARGRPFVAIVTSDHGESLGEEERWFHGKSLAPELLAIPLLVIGEGVEPGAVDSGVGHAAITPTLLAAASAPCQGCEHVDLRRQKGGRPVEGGLPPRLAYRIDGPYKLLLDLDTGHRRLFDLRSDPAERHDLAASVPTVTEALVSGLGGEDDTPTTAPDQLERLRSLGYAGS